MEELGGGGVSVNLCEGCVCEPKRVKYVCVNLCVECVCVPESV